jgi:hypothetical protein
MTFIMRAILPLPGLDDAKPMEVPSILMSNQQGFALSIGVMSATSCIGSPAIGDVNDSLTTNLAIICYCVLIKMKIMTMVKNLDSRVSGLDTSGHNR